MSLKTMRAAFEAIETQAARALSGPCRGRPRPRGPAHGRPSVRRGARAAPAPPAPDDSGRSCRPRLIWATASSAPAGHEQRVVAEPGHAARRRGDVARPLAAHDLAASAAPACDEGDHADEAGGPVVLAGQGVELGEQAAVVGRVVALAAGVARRDHSRARRPAPRPLCPSRRRRRRRRAGAAPGVPRPPGAGGRVRGPGLRPWPARWPRTS